MRHDPVVDNGTVVLDAKRNRSLSDAQPRKAFWLVATVSLMIATVWSVMGAWLVLPFAGLELGALYLAFRSWSRRADDYERVVIHGDRLSVECRTSGRVRRFDANRHWTQVIVRDGVGGRQFSLRSHGREIEFGILLSEGARIQAARKLRDHLRVEQ
jgi:uncharacterized membrane protein